MALKRSNWVASVRLGNMLPAHLLRHSGAEVVTENLATFPDGSNVGIVFINNVLLHIRQLIYAVHVILIRILVVPQY